MDELRPEAGRRTVSGGPLDGKPFAVSGDEVWRAWEQVRDNKGAPGVDGQSIAAFEERLEDNLYKVWNRMSAGSYFPPPVRAVEIPKAGGGTRTLGVPTIADRIAQTVAANRIGVVTHAEMNAAYDSGESVPLGRSVSWLVRYRDAWWVVYERGWLRIADDITAADLDQTAARLTQAEAAASRDTDLRSIPAPPDVR